MRDIGKNLREARVRRGLTQDELAERLHVSRQTVSNYETGRSRPDVEMLLSAAEQLEVDVQELLYGRPVSPERRREVRLLLVQGAVLAALGCAILLVRRWAGTFVRRWFTVAPLVLTQLTAVPVFYTLLGWALLQFCGTFLGAKRLEHRRVLRWGALLCLAVWAVLALPLAAWDIWDIARTLLHAPEALTDRALVLPRWWERALLWQLHTADRSPAVFVPIGGALWCTHGRGNFTRPGGGA